MWLYTLADGSLQLAAFDQDNLKLYVTISQIFSIFVIPFYTAPVTLTTVLTLTTDPSEYRGYLDFEHRDHDDQSSEETKVNGEKTRYWISSQDDLYQTSEFVKFILPFGIGVFLVFVWHVMATAGCVLGSALLYPVTWAEEKFALSKEVHDVSGHNVTEVAGNFAGNLASHVQHEAGSLIQDVVESAPGKINDL